MLTALALTALVGVGQDHALIMAGTKAEKDFIKDAARICVDRKLIPITLDELNAMLEAERVKDIAGCEDVACIAEIVGAYGMHYIVKVKPNEAATRAVITIHDLTNMGKAVAQQLVSHESAVAALTSSIEDFKLGRARVLELVKNVPCGYPWAKLAEVLGPADRKEPLDHPTTFYYFDIEIWVPDNAVRYIKEHTNGYYIMGCR